MMKLIRLRAYHQRHNGEVVLTTWHPSQRAAERARTEHARAFPSSGVTFELDHVASPRSRDELIAWLNREFAAYGGNLNLLQQYPAEAECRSP